MADLNDQTPLNPTPIQKKSQVETVGSDSSTNHGHPAGTGISSQGVITSTSTTVISSVATQRIITTQPRQLLPAAQDVPHDSGSPASPTTYSFYNIHPYNSSRYAYLSGAGIPTYTPAASTTLSSISSSHSSSSIVVSSLSQPSHRTFSVPSDNLLFTGKMLPSVNTLASSMTEPSPSRARMMQYQAMTSHHGMGMQHIGMGSMRVPHPQAAAATGMQGIQPTPGSMIRLNRPTIGMGHSQVSHMSMTQQTDVHCQMGTPQAHYMQSYNTRYMQPHLMRGHMGHTAVCAGQLTMASRMHPHTTSPHRAAAVSTPSQIPQVSAASMVEPVLTERDVATLIELFHSFSSKWNQIGLGLGFTQSELNNISHKPLLLADAPGSFLTELLSQWVQWPTVNHPTKPTLKALCGTLRSSLVGLGSLAEKVEREIIGECSMIIGQQNQIDVSGSCEPIGIASKIETLENRFDDLRTQIIDELSAKPGITVQKLLNKLTGLPLSLRKEYEASIEERFRFMRTEKGINELFMAHLNPLTSFIDYGLIEYFIRTFGSDGLKRDMRSYCSEMIIFMKETTIKQLIDHLPGQTEVPPKFSLIEAKIGQNASECTLEELNRIRKRYCSEVKLSEIVFHLVAIIESNSFIVRWLIPSALVSDIVKFARIVEQSFYQEFKITSLTLDGMWLFLSEDDIDTIWSRVHVSDTKFKDQFHTMYKQTACELEIEEMSKHELSSYLMDQRPNLQSNASVHLSEAILKHDFSLSVLDFRVLTIIIEKFGGDCLKRVMKSYCNYITAIYTEQSTAQEIIDLSLVQFKPSKYFVTVECRIMEKPSECTLEKLLNFRTRFCTIVNIDEACFVMCEIKMDMVTVIRGSFTVSWLVPSSLAFDLLKTANQMKETVLFQEFNIPSLHLDSMWLYHHLFMPFGAKLKERYQQTQGSPSPFEWIPSPTKKIFRLAMIQRERVQRGHIEDRFVRMSISGRVDDILHAKSPVELKHIFRSTLHGGEIILIEGAPGSGKSTLTVHVCQRWGKGELFQQFTVVILVQLRDPTVQRAQTIADLLPVENVAVAQELAAELIATNGHGVLWVLDGWDELPPHLQRHSMFRKLVQKTLNKSSVIVTSRPISSGDLRPVVSSRIEVLGFTPEEQKQYITECLKGDTKALEALLEKIQENPVIQSICYLPLNAAFIVHTFKYRGQSLPNTEYEIYLSVILSCIQRHYEREGRGDDLPRELASLDYLSRSEAVREPFQCLCELAYRGVMENKVTFSSSDLPEGSNTLSLLQAIESFLQSGKSVFYNFLHLSIQEVLSAYYIATRLSDSEQVSQFQQLFDQPRFAAVFQFYAAITKLKSPGICQVIDRIVAKKSKPLLVSLLRCLHEAQDPSLCRYVAERLDSNVKTRYVNIDLSETSLSPLDCLSISFFLSFSGMAIEGDLWQCSCGDLGAKSLAKYLDGSVDHVSNVNIYLRVIDNNIHEEGASHIARIENFIEHLELSCNPIGNTGASKVIRKIATLKTLILCDCGITSRGAEDLSRALAQNSSLEKLDIGNNNLGDDGISHMAEGLKQNKQLKELWISGCGITDKGAASLASALSVNNSLKVLHMGGLERTLTEVGLSTITQSLANNSKFMKLTIPGSGYYDSIAGHLHQKVNKVRERNGLPPIEIKASAATSVAAPSQY